MNESRVGKYTVSSYEEGPYLGAYDTPEDAALDYCGDDDGVGIWIGVIRAPEPIESFVFDYDSIEEEMYDHEDYSGEWFEGIEATEEQKDELIKSLRKTLAGWLDSHKLRPNCFVVDNPEQWITEGGKAVRYRSGT